MKSFRPPRSSRGRRIFGLSRHTSNVVALTFAAVTLLSYFTYYGQAQNETAAAWRRGSANSKANFVPGELLVRFRPGSDLARIKKGASATLSLQADGRDAPAKIQRFGGSDLVDGLMLVRVDSENTSSAFAALAGRADVLYVEPNYIRHAEVVPNDPRYADLYALKNTPPGNAGISAEAAWDTSTGSHSVVVGVIDSGIDIGHGDLKDNIFVNQGETPNNGIDDDNNGFIDDLNGWDFVNNDRTVFDNAGDDAHGTHVAGTIGARGNNSVGVVGVNWDVQIMPLKVLGPAGASDSELLAAFSYAKMMRQRGVNLRVLNNSYGAQGFSQSLRDGIKELGDAGILFVAAAGNDTLNNDFVPEYPASYELANVISVAASDNTGSFASTFSNRGPQSVHLVAPGQGILSTTPRGYTGSGLVAANTDPEGSTYSLFSGTSTASPHVAGTAALACAANPGISLQKLRAAVLFSGDIASSQTITQTRLNAKKSLLAAVENDTTPPAAATNFRINSQTGRRVELRWNEAGDDGTTAVASLDEITFTDAATSEEFRLFSTRVLDPGNEHTGFVGIPFKHTAGQITLRTFDNVGNSSTATIAVSVAADVADPYIVSVEAPAALTAQNSGTRVGVRGDDVMFQSVNLPFTFPFFGSSTLTSVVVSSNGALYFPIGPDLPLPIRNSDGGDGAVATTDNLAHLAMIAGMWADLRTDRRASDDVYMVQPDQDRVIFRWQAVTFGSETPANFEIELRRDGTIQTRYGDGNQNLSPVVVGISGGDPATYVVPTHTSEASPIILTNAQSVTFALRNPPPPPTSDLSVTATASPNPVVTGQPLTFTINVANLGPNSAHDLVMTDVLPAGTSFVSCTSSHISATCTGPPAGTNGTVTGKRANLDSALVGASPIRFTIVVNVTAAAGTVLQNNASATSFRADPNPANNSASSLTTVVAESFFNGVKAIAAGRMHTSSVRNDGTVWNWGMGSNGQLGNGNSGIGISAATPVQVTGLEGVTKIADGNGFVYALKSDGTVWGWGVNSSGQLGDGSTTERPRPVQVSGLTNVKGIDAGSFYGAAVKLDGTVWIWGGTGGIGSTNFVVNTTPVQLTGISNVSAISAGGNHLLMLKADKTVWAVGANSRGELGDGTTTNRPFPVQVNGLSNVTAIAAGGDEFSEAVKEDGTVWAWGINFNGQLGPGGGSNNFDPHPNPLQVTGLPGGMTNIAAGEDFALGLAGDGTVWGWGSDSNWQTGQGTGVGNNPTPKQIANFNGVVALAAGINHSVALKTDGSLWTWGGNSEGQLGDASTTQRPVPVRVSGLETVSTPSFNPPGGSFTNAVDVTITCATPGATIHFTTNSNEPTESDPVIASGSSVHITSFTYLRARAWKSGLISSSSSFAQYDINISVPPPQLLLDQSGSVSNQLAALEALLFLSDPFQVVNSADWLNLGSDKNTRVIIFATNLQLAQGETASSVVVNLVDSNNQSYDVVAEDVRSVPNSNFTQVIFRLPNNLAVGTCTVKVKAHGQVSNAGTIRIKV